MRLQRLTLPPLRPTVVRLHRWVGLALAGFLALAGLTGALLAWVDELEAALSPALFDAPPPSPDARRLDPLVLRQVVQAAHPHAYAAMVPLHAEPGRAVMIPLFGLPAPGTARPAELADDQVFIDPYTGQILGQRRWGDIAQGVKNLMPFVYRLHYTLALGEVGGTVFGVVALLWTIDCFFGAYLTLPLRRRAGNPASASRFTSWFTSWIRRWRPAWTLRLGSGRHKLNFDLHRAGGLWTWAMLLVLAWSGVAFNLAEVYDPVMKSVFAHQPDTDRLPRPLRQVLTPAIDWQAARDIGRRRMAEQARVHGFGVQREMLLVHDPRHGPNGIYRYQVQSTRDIRERWGSTQVVFDARSGELLQTWLPTGAASGDTLRTWLTTLHMAQLGGMVGGVPFKAFVSSMGLAVGLLSITGVLIWMGRRRAQRAAERMQRSACSAQSPGANPMR